jgi:hypothetical protein
LSGPGARSQGPRFVVTGLGPLALPAGGATPFAITVDNSGPGFAGRVELVVSASDQSRLPLIRMDKSIDSGTVKTWTPLSPIGTPGTQTFTVTGLSFHTGQSSREFRIHVPPDALGRKLHVTAHVHDAAGGLAGSAEFDVTVIDAALQVRTTFLGQLWRGGGYREFDVTVHNPSTITYRNVSASLVTSGLTGVPTSPEAGSLTAKDLQLQKRSGASWTHLTVVTGCDPTQSGRSAARSTSRPARRGPCTCASGWPPRRRRNRTQPPTACTPQPPETSPRKAKSPGPS